MAIEDIIDARIAEALKDYKVGLKQLPIYALRDRLNQDGSADGDTSLLPHSIGVDALAVMPTAKITGAPVIPSGVPTLVALGTVRFNTASMTATANQLTAPVDGIYLATGYIGWAAAGGARWAYVQSSTGEIEGDYRPAPPAADNQRQSVVLVTNLKRGEYVTLGSFQNTGANLATETCSLSLTFLSNYLTQA